MLNAIICFSHLRWNFTFQRPNHLMSRFAKERRVFYVEEPVFDGDETKMIARHVSLNLTVCTPHLPDTDVGRSEKELSQLITRYFSPIVKDPLLWFYTPMALPWAEGLQASVTIYDCMDELSLFLGAPKALLIREQALMARADLVFTGGQSLYEAKRGKHPNVHAFPSSVDAEHFGAQNANASEPDDQKQIGAPRIGFFGVIDERMDLNLLSKVAVARPQYNFVLVGPVVKIDDASLPRADNVHYLGAKPYAELPKYLHGWDVAMMPFALNEATRFISPTKTLEYMAGGKPIVSTAVRDVVAPYGERGLVRIADSETFATAIDDALQERATDRLHAFTEVLQGTSWDQTWRQMSVLVGACERSTASKGVN
jgi:glycosyltransferase involved in cell wall biosynthesis